MATQPLSFVQSRTLEGQVLQAHLIAESHK
jgi:hypothetical protein